MRFWLDGACIAGTFAVDERQISCSGKIEWRPGHHSPEYVCVRIIRRSQKHAGSVPVLPTLLSSTWDGHACIVRVLGGLELSSLISLLVSYDLSPLQSLGFGRGTSGCGCGFMHDVAVDRLGNEHCGSVHATAICRLRIRNAGLATKATEERMNGVPRDHM